MSRDGWAAVPRGATGLSAVCDFGISYSYLLTILVTIPLPSALDQSNIGCTVATDQQA